MNRNSSHPQNLGNKHDFFFFVLDETANALISTM